MRFYLLSLALTGAVLLGFSAGGAQAGSFFGPFCYGARYTNRYPNRSHNVFGCGPGCHCKACHPFFRHCWFRRKHVEPPIDGMPVEATPAPLPPAQPPS